MRAKLLGLLAVGLLVGPSSAHAIAINISGSAGGVADGMWEVSVTLGTPSSLHDVLDDQIWWGDRGLADLFAMTLGDGLGFPNTNRLGLRGPGFAVCNDSCLFSVPVPGFDFQGRYLTGAGVMTSFALDYEADIWFATAVRASVPEPATFVLLGLGLAGLALARRPKTH